MVFIPSMINHVIITTVYWCSFPNLSNTIDMCCLSTKHAALRRKSKDGLARNQDNVSEWGSMCLSVDCCLSELALKKNSTKCVCLVQVEIIISSKYNLFSPWYNRYIAEVVLGNNHSIILFRSCHGRDHMVTGLTTVYAISGYHQEFESCW